MEKESLEIGKLVEFLPLNILNFTDSYFVLQIPLTLKHA